MYSYTPERFLAKATEQLNQPTSLINRTLAIRPTVEIISGQTGSSVCSQADTPRCLGRKCDLCSLLGPLFYDLHFGALSNMVVSSTNIEDPPTGRIVLETNKGSRVTYDQGVVTYGQRVKPLKRIYNF